jgi:cell division transport system permease protein
VSNMFLVTLVTPGFVLGTLTWIFILGGTIVGAVGSSVALRKFLDV